MPEFYTPTGQICSADEAKPGGRLRPGYKECLADGERIGVSILMLDATPAALQMDAARLRHDALRAAANGQPMPVTADEMVRRQALTAAQLAVIDADPRKAWRNDPALQAAQATRDAIRTLRGF